MDTAYKILHPQQLVRWRKSQRDAGRRLVVTNGCFDLLHVGHVQYLEAARAQGNCLLIGLNGDLSVQALKGAGRPIQTENDRARVLAALACVDAVCIFPEPRATRFLAEAQPDIYVKGGDYSLDTLHPDERTAIESHPTTIVFLPFVQGKSTSHLINKLRQL